VVRSAYPEVLADSLEPLGSGWEFDAFLTSDGWVFRFPRRADADHLFEREDPALRLARSVLPSSVAVPSVHVLDHKVSGFPYRVAVHHFIAGVPADRIPAGLRPALAASLGEALSAIHSVTEDVAREAGLEELDRAEPGRIEWFASGSAGVRSLNAQHGGLDQAVQWLDRVDDPLRRLEAPVRMIHQDLSPEHLLADPETGRLIGILDWTDAILGDPARDFMPLVTFGGWSLVDEVLANYAHGVDAGFWDRLRFMARLLPLMWLGYAHLRGEDVGRHLRWVRNCFAGLSTS
jgi:aminoglycoside phosphotransferase (APT) family kinase protein